MQFQSNSNKHTLICTLSFNSTIFFKWNTYSTYTMAAHSPVSSTCFHLSIHSHKLLPRSPAQLSHSFWRVLLLLSTMSLSTWLCTHPLEPEWLSPKSYTSILPGPPQPLFIPRDRLWADIILPRSHLHDTQQSHIPYIQRKAFSGDFWGCVNTMECSTHTNIDGTACDTHHLPGVAYFS